MKKLSVSILSADFGRLAEQVHEVEEAGADWIHVDVMDGHFVPNITIGPQAVRAIREATRLPLDVHLMIEKPEYFIEEFADAGADWLGIHVETAGHLHRTVQMIKKLGLKATITLNPATPLNTLENIIYDVDMILLMTVNPGFGGQEFIEHMLPKIERCRRLIDEQKPEVLLQVDGGVHMGTIDNLVQAGVDVFVAGSAVFVEGKYGENIKNLKSRMMLGGK